MGSDYAAALTAVTVIFTFISTAVILARLILFCTTKTSSPWPEAAIFIAWIASLGFTIATSVGLADGVGSSRQLPKESLYKIFRAIYALQILYTAAVYFVKLSMLLLYLRLTVSLPGLFRIGSQIMLVIVTAQYVSTIVVTAILCRPISHYWIFDGPGTCIDIPRFVYSFNIFTVVSDIIILLLPVQTLWTVNRPLVEKIALVGVFLGGTLATIASGIRIYTIHVFAHSMHPIRDAALNNIWSLVEVSLGILCASGPALKAFYNRFLTKPVKKAENETFTVTQYPYYMSQTAKSNKTQRLGILDDLDDLEDTQETLVV
jgi:hypothetical protein